MQAIELASDFNDKSLEVQWGVVSAALRKGDRQLSTSSDTVVPDDSRHPSEQVTAEALLASIHDDQVGEHQLLRCIYHAFLFLFLVQLFGLVV